MINVLIKRPPGKAVNGQTRINGSVNENFNFPFSGANKREGNWQRKMSRKVSLSKMHEIKGSKAILCRST